MTNSPYTDLFYILTTPYVCGCGRELTAEEVEQDDCPVCHMSDLTPLTREEQAWQDEQAQIEQWEREQEDARAWRDHFKDY